MIQSKVLFSHNSILGEGAWYDWERDVLLWLDIFGCEIHEYDVRANRDTCHKAPLPVTTIVPSKDGFILGTTKGVMKCDRHFCNFTSAISPVYDYSKFRCNDGKCGPDGRFWIGIMELSGKKGMGALYAVSENSCELLLGNLDVPNGIVWTRDKQKMFFTDTLDSTVYSYDLSGGSVGVRKPLFTADDGMTDGMAIDENDNLWVAVWGSGCVYHISSLTGKVLEKVVTTAPQVSSVALCNGKMYITSAASGMNAGDLQKHPDSGSLFIADVPARGLESYRFL